MSTCPHQYVEAPPVAPRGQGLFAAAAFPGATGHFECGVEYEPLSCHGKAFTTNDPCRYDGTTAQGPRTVTDAATTDTDTTLTSATADFTAADVGRAITGSGIPANTTIDSVTNGTTVELSDPATATASGVTVVIAGEEFYPGELSSWPSGVPLVQGDPFTVYAGFTCSLVGRTLEDIKARAEAALALSEQRAVEFTYWTGVEGNDPHLADPSADLLDAGAVSAAEGLRLIEDHLAREYAGSGFVHAPAGLAVPWNDYLVRDGSGPLRTKLGTTFAFGGGYSEANTSPAGAAAAAGTYWVYVTGQVAIWRSEVFFNPDPITQALNRGTNTVDLLAARTYVVAHECLLAAVLIDPSL